ncbi:MAG: cytochrome P450, partial [Pseudomonadota bacterium]
PTFSPAALKAMTPALTAPFEALAEDWAHPSGAGQPRDVDAAMVAATLEVIERVLFTDRTEFDLSVVASGTEAILKPMSWVVVGAILNLPEWLPYPGKRAQFRARDEIRAMVLQMVARRRREVAAGAAPDDLAAALLKARDPETDRPLSDDDMADMLLTLVGAGHETSAHTLSWALYCLAHQPRLQDALAAEAREALSEVGAEVGDGDAPDAASPLTQVAPERLALTEAVIKETLRLFPVVPMMGRVATQDETWRGERVPAGAMCAVPIYALHRHDLYWERPDEFDIGRWLNQPAPPRTLYMPFGAGPRVCIGMRLAMMEMVLGLAAIMARSRLEPGAETDCDPLHRVTLCPRDGLYLNVFPRD